MTDFNDAVHRMKVDREHQYVFAVEVVLRDKDLNNRILDEAMDNIRTIGSVEVIDVQELDTTDPRRIS